ncbi:MAG: MopE-related protein, partial [bacterium]|nr:MopE-related protein [bacterium]
ATEICDNDVDDNCNGVTDDDATTTTWWHDDDNDTFGDPEDTVEDCAPPEGYVDNDEDCDDSESTTNPDAEEICFDGVDNNCDSDGNDCELSGTITASDADSRFLGTNDSEYAGETLISVGDIDGSGYADIIIGAPMNEEGAISIIFDPSTGDTNLTDADIIFFGQTSGDYAGKAITTGDIDDDGETDLVIGAPGADEIYAFLGPISGFDATLSPEDADIVYMSEESGDWGGVSLASGGDMDGDGDCELVMGAYQNTNSDESTNAGAVYVFRGPEEAGTYDLGYGEQVFEGASESTRLGKSIDGSNDIDGDGRVDLLIGGYEDDSFTGIAYLIYGDSGDGGTDYAEDFDTLTLPGEAAGDYGGWDVTYTGDFDGTRAVSFAISAYKEDTGGTDAGAVYLFNTVSGTSLGDADVKFTGEAADDYAGYSIDGGCDVNGDGYDDLLIGAIGNDDAGTDAGAAYLMYGTSSALTSPFSLASADAKFTGETAGDKLGMAITCMADTDGYDNILVGAPYWDNTITSTTESGAVYLFQGTTW